MRAANLLILLAVGGCVTPTQTTRRTEIGVERGRDLPGPAAPVELTARASGREVFIHAAQPRRCEHDVYAKIEVRSYTSGKVGGLDGAAPHMWIFMVPTLIVSGVVTGAVIAVSGDETWTERELRAVRTTSCPVLATQRSIDVTLPSGATITAVTDIRGNALISIPRSEPDTGTVTFRSGDARGGVLHYDAPVEP